MRRATITIPDDLADAVDSYVRGQDAQPPLTAVVQAALRQYLSDRGYLRVERSLQVTPAKRGSGKRDISSQHDRYLSHK